MTATPHDQRPPPGTRATGARTSTYGRHMSWVLVAAFTLSVVHTIYAWVEGIEDPTFTVDTPLAWGFYAVGFGVGRAGPPDRAVGAGRGARLPRRRCSAIAFFYYPTTFGPAQQTVFGWFENDVYVGLLVVATYLGVAAAAAHDAHPGVTLEARHPA